MSPVTDLLLIARKSAKLSQTQLAEKLGFYTNDIHRWETGKVMPSAEIFLKIIDACGMKVVRQETT